MNNNLCNPSGVPERSRRGREDDFSLQSRPHPCSLLGPSIEEQIEVIQNTIDILRDSFMDRFGPTKGQVTEPDVVEELRCLEATLGILRIHEQAVTERSKRPRGESLHPRPKISEKTDSNCASGVWVAFQDFLGRIFLTESQHEGSNDWANFDFGLRPRAKRGIVAEWGHSSPLVDTSCGDLDVLLC